MDEPLAFDKFGVLEHMENVQHTILRARPVVVFRSEWGNATVVSFPEAKEDLLKPYGVGPVTPLGTPWQKLFITGVASDCRVVAHYARQLALEHMFDFDGPAPTMFIAEHIGRLLQDASMSPGRRPLACTVLLVDCTEKRILRVDAGGEVTSVAGAAVGRGQAKGEDALLKGLRQRSADGASTSIDNQLEIDRALAKSVLLEMLGKGRSGEHNEEHGDEDDDVAVIVLPDRDPI